MAEFPALTLWTDAYLSDTRHLSTLEHGAYLLLLMEAWRRPNCDIPDDDKILARLSGLSMDEWLEVKDAVMAFWKRDGRSKTWSQKRLSLERGKARVRSKSQSDKATKRWKADKKPDAAALPEQCPEYASTATATATATEEEGSVAKATVGQPPTVDLVKVIFDTGLGILATAGYDAKQARSVIGRWRKQHGDAAVLVALSSAQVARPSEPLEWITRSLQGEARKAGASSDGNPSGHRGAASGDYRPRDRRDSFTRAIDETLGFD